MMVDERSYRFAVAVNPEPWGVGPLAVKKNGSKSIPFMGRNEQLDNYKSAVAAQLRLQAREYQETLGTVFPLEGKVAVHLAFKRRLDQYELNSGRKSRNKQADATNMQKAIEDAMQDVLLGNDRNVWAVTSEIREQGPDVFPGTIVTIEKWTPYVPVPGSDEAKFWEMADKKFREFNGLIGFDNEV